MSNENNTETVSSSTTLTEAPATGGQNATPETPAETPAERKLVKFNVKVSYHTPDTFWVNISRNIRTRPGLIAFGVTAERDSYDVPGIVTDILEMEGIVRVPIVACWTIHPETGKKVLEVLQGNRRAMGAQAIYSDPNTPENVKKNVSKVPCWALTDLTEAQKQELIFDQDSKDFLDSEVVRDVFHLRSLGWTFDQIVMSRFKPLCKIMTKGKELASDVRAISDPVMRKKKITTGMHGTIGNGLLDGFAVGPWLQKQILASYMLRDGLIDAGGPQMPYFNALKNLQGRVGALKKAKSLDGAKFNPLILMPDTEFKRLADKYRAEDYGSPEEGKKGTTKKMLGKEGVNTLDALLQSAVAKSVILRVKGEPAPDLQVQDAMAVTFQTKAQLAESMLDQLTPDAKEVVRQCLLSPNVEDFQVWLEANVQQTEISEPSTEENPADVGEHPLTEAE